MPKAPTEITTFLEYLKTDFQKSAFSENIFESYYKKYSKYLDSLKNQWFKIKKSYTDEHIASQLFIKEVKISDLKNLIKFQLIALITSIDRIYNLCLTLNSKIDHDNLHSELKLFRDMVFESIVFVDWSMEVMEGSTGNFGYMKRNILHSKEIYHASIDILKEKINLKGLGGFVVRPSSILLLRQALEIRLKNAFGIDLIKDKDGRIQKIPGNIFISLVKKSNGNVILPIKTHLILRIYEWCNYYVHGGLVPYLWEIDWAQHLLGTLYDSDTYKGTFNTFGAIKIKKNYYEKIDEIILKLLFDTPRKINIFKKLVNYLGFKNSNIKNYYIEKLKFPEAIIID